MKKFLALGIAFVLAASTASVWISAGQQAAHPGSEPYTPTKLEWLVLDMQASLRTDLSSETRMAMAFVPNFKTDAVVVLVDYLPDVDRKAMNSRVENARQILKIKAAQHGWDWVRIEERIEQNRAK